MLSTKERTNRTIELVGESAESHPKHELLINRLFILSPGDIPPVHYPIVHMRHPRVLPLEHDHVGTPEIVIRDLALPRQSRRPQHLRHGGPQPVRVHHAVVGPHLAGEGRLGQEDEVAVTLEARWDLRGEVVAPGGGEELKNCCVQNGCFLCVT